MQLISYHVWNFRHSEAEPSPVEAKANKQRERQIEKKKKKHKRNFQPKSSDPIWAVSNCQQDSNGKPCGHLFFCVQITLFHNELWLWMDPRTRADAECYISSSDIHSCFHDLKVKFPMQFKSPLQGWARHCAVFFSIRGQNKSRCHLRIIANNNQGEYPNEHRWEASL